jgi:hypothetical protein
MAQKATCITKLVRITLPQPLTSMLHHNYVGHYSLPFDTYFVNKTFWLPGKM